MYLLKSAACMSFLLLFYKLLLEKENMHVLKRFYLLAVPMISFGIPVISFPEYITVTSEGTATFNSISVSETADEFPLFETLVSSIYIFGILFFGSRFVINLRSLLKRARNNPKVEATGATHVLLKEQVIPHTFWSYIYLNKKKFVEKQIPQEVMDHELAHVRQKHTADILFMEILQVLFWFLPLIYLLKKAVKLNHEFLADSAALRKTENIGLYQQILLSFSSQEQNELVNSINYQSIKKRFTVMKKQPSQKAILVRTFIFLPLLAVLLYSFSSRETVVLEDNKPNEELFQEKATPKMLAEYNKWAKHYSNNEDALIQKKVWDRMKYIYRIMTPDQRKGAEEFPSLNPQQILTVVENKDSDKNRAAVRQEREVIRKERKEQREEREVEKTERREMQVERRERQRQVPPPPAPPAPPTPKEIETPLPPSPPSVPQNIDVPMPPPPPPSPIESMKTWMEEGAEFYLNGKKVTGETALEVVKESNGKNLSVQVEENASGKIVRLSDKKR